MSEEASRGVLHQRDPTDLHFYLTVPTSRCQFYTLLAIREVADRHPYVPLTPRLRSSSHAGPQNYGRRGQQLF